MASPTLRRSIPTLLVAVALCGCTSGADEPVDGGGGTNTVTIEASPNLVEDDGRFLSIPEVGFADGGSVHLTNFTSGPASLAGLYVCEPPECVALPDVEVEPGATVVVTAGDGEGLDGVVVTGADLDLDPASGEIGLYASEDVNAADDIRGYLEWGSTPHEGTPTAIEAGLWIEGSYLNSSPTATRVFKTEDQRWDWE